MFILDLGSGNSCKNDIRIINKMIEELANIDKDRQVIIKWQLFLEAGDNIPLKAECFEYAYHKAKLMGFQTTASVFDELSVKYLLKFPVPFIKIANNPNLYPLIGEIPRSIPVIISYGSESSLDILENNSNMNTICCISEYPARKEDYTRLYSSWELHQGISDHTTNWDLYNEYKPEIYEVHFKLEDSKGLDAGGFARTSEQLEEIL